MRRLLLVLALVSGALAVGQCAAPGASTGPLALASAAFASGQPIPRHFACDGENVSPPLAWTGAPAATASFALVMDDPDAVAVVGSVYDHWLLFNIPPSATSLAEGVAHEDELPDGSRHGQNSARVRGYSGPCPPAGPSHGYVFTLYALDTLLDLEPGARKAEILSAMEGHILAQAQIVGQYASQ